MTGKVFDPYATMLGRDQEETLVDVGYAPIRCHMECIGSTSNDGCVEQETEKKVKGE